MIPILTLREEFVCLVVLAFLYSTSLIYPMGEDRRYFNRLSLFAVIHVLFDIITVITVNNLESVATWLNNICHFIYLISVILYFHEMFNYIFVLSYPNHPKQKNVYKTSLALLIIYCLCLPFLNITYERYGNTNAASGGAAYVGFAMAYIYILCCLSLLFRKHKSLPRLLWRTLVPMLLVLLVMETCQLFDRQFLFTGAGVTIATLGFFFSLENPARVFEQKIITDALTGVRSRHSYNQDILRFQSEFEQAPDIPYTFVFFDINNLRSVNAQYGHQEGDRNITFIASTLSLEMKHAYAIYRMGGDEFLAVYRGEEEGVIRGELQRVQSVCLEKAADFKYPPSVAIGYAVSGPEYKSLLDVIRTADYVMYRNKESMKENKTYLDGGDGMRYNLAGLTDRLFTAMCSSNDRTYPFVTNMETGVTRISPSWAQYFGLNGEFHADFVNVWQAYIHPGDRKQYFDNFTAVISGKQKYHNCVYRALNTDGKYVTCVSHGSIYHGNDGEPDIFAGYVVNHGARENVDPTTGLQNFLALSSRLYATRASKTQAFILSLRINNLSRINMLYGYEGGNRVLCEMASFFTKEVKNIGEVFCHDGNNFYFYFQETPRQTVATFYTHISNVLIHGLPINNRSVPLNISGGAFEILPDCTLDDMSIQRCLIYALDESAYSQQDKLVFYDAINSEGESPNFDLLAAIHRDAVNEQQYFRLRYQPIVDSQTGRVVGAEALLRWIHPTLGEIPPGRFIAFLENDPSYYSLGIYILDLALADARVWREMIPDFRINVNITALQLQNSGFITEVLSLLARHNYPPQGLILELTERCKELDITYLSDQIAALRKAGLLVAFDDMGTGYSTVAHLLNIPVDEIKLDRTFVSNLMQMNGYRLFADALVRAGAQSASRYIVCFEGVETEETLDFIRNYGDTVCQGYLFSKPLLPDEFNAYIENQL